MNKNRGKRPGRAGKRHIKKCPDSARTAPWHQQTSGHAAAFFCSAMFPVTEQSPNTPRNAGLPAFVRISAEMIILFAGPVCQLLPGSRTVKGGLCFCGPLQRRQPVRFHGKNQRGRFQAFRSEASPFRTVSQSRGVFRNQLAGMNSRSLRKAIPAWICSSVSI